MMNLRYFTNVLILIILAFITSCNIEPYEGDIPNSKIQDGVFKVDFDGKTFISDTPVATVLEGAINITGFKTSTNEAVILTLIGNSVGTYQLGVTQNQVEVNGAAYNTNVNGTGNTWSAVTDFVTSQGQVTITEIDEANKTISGTFFFTGHHVSLASKEFTNGVFTNVSFEGGLVSNTGNSFFAKVDGVEFVEDSVNGIATSLPGLSTIGISATKNNLQTIGLNFDSNIEPGNYEFSGLSIPIAQYNLSLTDSNLGSGTFTIITHDKPNKHIVGTFQFTASPLIGNGATYAITEGSFDIFYL